MQQTVFPLICVAIGLDGKETVLIDVRNTYETDIGHFEHPDREGNMVRAIDPQTRQVVIRKRVLSRQLKLTSI